MDAFMAEAAPLIFFEQQPNIVESFRAFRATMKFAIQVLNGRLGKILGALLGRAQTNPQLLEAYLVGMIQTTPQNRSRIYPRGDLRRSIAPRHGRSN